MARRALDQIAAEGGLRLDSRELAAAMDARDPLARFRQEFHLPSSPSPHPTVYMCGNSLGLMPKAARSGVEAELEKWARRGVCGHFEGELPWASCEEALPPLLAEVVGAEKPELEIGAMNSLTVNLHLLMAAFYRPEAGRAAVIIEGSAFPSDRYAVASQIEHHGFSPSEWLIEALLLLPLLPLPPRIPSHVSPPRHRPHLLLPPRIPPPPPLPATPNPVR